MELFLKQRVFSWGDSFTVYDRLGEERFYVRGDVFTLGKKLHILDLNENELCYIEQKLWSFVPKYLLFKRGENIASVTKELTLFRQEYTVEGFGWQVEGDFIAHEYTISAANGTVAAVSKEWMSWGDAYRISIADGFDPVDVLAVVTVIDACLAAANTAN